MRMKVVCLTLSALIAVATPKSSTKPNRSGIWTLDLSKSSIGPPTEARLTTMEVAYDGSRLEVVELVRGVGGENILQQQYTLDGRKKPIATPVGMKFVSARCTGKAIRIRFTQRNNDQIITALEEWRLSHGGMEMCIKRRAGRSVQRLVFRRSIELTE
jgi:hypothetical protein